MNLIPESYDKHLNIFWNYNGNPHWEDNITKALINTLSTSTKESQIKIIEHLLGEKMNINKNNIEIKYDLQNPYIKNITNLKCSKYMVGISPTGKIWDEELVSIFNEINFENFDLKRIEQDSYLKEKLGKIFNEDKKEFLKDALKGRSKKGDSRPDAWIFIYNKEKLEIIIAIESKLWDLDPYQLDNHLDKSLGINKDKRYYLSTFDNICKELKKLNPLKSDVQWHFLDYMEKLGYYINTEKISKKDLHYVIQNKDKSLLKNKWDKYLTNYFNSIEFSNKEIKYGIEYKSKNNQIHLKKLGKLGNIYFDPIFDFNEDKDITNEVFFIGTEIGVSDRWWNEHISNLIKDNNFRNQIEKIYEKKGDYRSYHETFIRINCMSKSLYFIVDGYNNILDCLDRKESINYLNKLSKEECIEEIKTYIEESSQINSINLKEVLLTDIQKNEPHLIKIVKKINKWKWGSEGSPTSYNLMSYARLIDYIPLKLIENKSQKEFNVTFDKLIDRHIKGLLFIEKSIKKIC